MSQATVNLQGDMLGTDAIYNPRASTRRGYIALSMTHGIVCTLMVDRLERILHQVGPKRTRSFGSRSPATRLRAAAKRRHTPRPREDELAHPADTSITSLASAAGLFSSWRLSALTLAPLPAAPPRADGAAAAAHHGGALRVGPARSGEDLPSNEPALRPPPRQRHSHRVERLHRYCVAHGFTHAHTAVRRFFWLKFPAKEQML
jgi:hypothetical protein